MIEVVMAKRLDGRSWVFPAVLERNNPTHRTPWLDVIRETNKGEGREVWELVRLDWRMELYAEATVFFEKAAPDADGASGGRVRIVAHTERAARIIEKGVANLDGRKEI